MSKRKKKFKEQIRSEPSVATQAFLLSDSWSGVAGYTRLSDNPEVKLAIKTIADLVSSMTIQLLENKENGDVRVKNALSRKLDINPYKTMTRKQWVFNIVESLLNSGDGNAVIYPYITKEGYIENLKLLEPKYIRFDVINENEYAILYKGTRYSPDEVVHITINTTADEQWVGKGYRVVLKDIVNNLKQATATKKEFLSGKYNPSLIVKVDAFTAELSEEEGRRDVYKKYLETSEAGQPWIIPADLIDVEQIKPLNLNDIAINDTVQMDKKTVAGIFGIPAFLIGVGSFNKDEYNNFINTTIKSIAESIQQALTLQLIYADNLYVKFNSRSLMAYDMKDMYAIGADAYVRGLVVGNEVRDWINMEPMDGLDERVILENYIPANMIGNQKKLDKGGETKDE